MRMREQGWFGRYALHVGSLCMCAFGAYRSICVNGLRKVQAYHGDLCIWFPKTPGRSRPVFLEGPHMSSTSMDILYFPTSIKF